MALQLHSPNLFTNKPYRHNFFLPQAPILHFTVKSQNSSDPSEPSVKVTETPTRSEKLGFGSSPSASSKKKRSPKGERATIIRRSPVEKPTFISKEDEAKVIERSQNENAFLLAWLGLGVLILVQGILLAASGFLPEEWDKLLVKYLYPSFTPTVGVFVAGTVTYGVIKYLQNEELKGQK